MDIYLLIGYVPCVSCVIKNSAVIKSLGFVVFFFYVRDFLLLIDEAEPDRCVLNVLG